jgi:miniconductance mechanosensitive channel
MMEAGGRRIKRPISFKQSSFKFVNQEEDLKFYRKIHSISQYVDEKQAVIDKQNQKTGADTSIVINGQSLTNIGLFRKYAEVYLKNHPGVHKKMSIMVRHLEPTEKGLPLEIYCFTNTTVWAEYENIMADIFDHLISAAKYFDLEIFEDLTNE